MSLSKKLIDANLLAIEICARKAEDAAEWQSKDIPVVIPDSKRFVMDGESYKIPLRQAREVDEAEAGLIAYMALGSQGQDVAKKLAEARKTLEQQYAGLIQEKTGTDGTQRAKLMVRHLMDYAKPRIQNFFGKKDGQNPDEISMAI